MGHSRTWSGSFRIEPQVAEEHVRAFARVIADGPYLGRCGRVLSAGRVFVVGDAASLEARARGWLEWDGGEKFTAGLEWLELLVSAFFEPRHSLLSGTVTWEGEEPGDRGELSIVNRLITAKVDAVPETGLEPGARSHWESLLLAPDLAQRLERSMRCRSRSPRPSSSPPSPRCW